VKCKLKWEKLELDNMRLKKKKKKRSNLRALVVITTPKPNFSAILTASGTKVIKTSQIV